MLSKSKFGQRKIRAAYFALKIEKERAHLIKIYSKSGFMEKHDKESCKDIVSRLQLINATISERVVDLRQ